VEPYHDRVREAVLAQLDPGRKRSLHEALAVAFESWEHADPETLAGHWRDAGNGRRAGKHAMRAGDEAARKFAFERAAEWYQRALEWVPGRDADRAELEVKIGDMLANAGRGALAAHHFEAAAAVLPPRQALDLRRRAAEELLSAGRFEEGDAVLRTVLEAVGIDLPRTPLAALFGLLFFRFIVLVRGLGFRERTKDDIAAHALTRLEACNGVGRALALVDTIRGAYFQTRALLGALSLGEPAMVARSLAIEAIYLAAQGSSARATRLLVQARALAERRGSLQLQAFVETLTSSSASSTPGSPAAIAAPTFFARTAQERGGSCARRRWPRCGSSPGRETSTSSPSESKRECERRGAAATSTPEPRCARAS
jgi:tetratricopeptide (TPR) repeat protein